MRTPLAVASLTTILTFIQQPGSSPALTFKFQSNFWVNLHHLVRGDARRASLKLPVVVSLESLASDDRTGWSEALTAYSNLATKNLIFDPRLISTNNALSALTGANV